MISTSKNPSFDIRVIFLNDALTMSNFAKQLRPSKDKEYALNLLESVLDIFPQQNGELNFKQVSLISSKLMIVRGRLAGFGLEN